MIESKTEYRAILKNLLGYEETVNNVLSYLEQSKPFTIKVDNTIVKFRDENDNAIGELTMVATFISDELKKRLEDIEQGIVTANTDYETFKSTQ